MKLEAQDPPRGIKREFGLISPEKIPPKRRRAVGGVMPVDIDLTQEEDGDDVLAVRARGSPVVSRSRYLTNHIRQTLKRKA